jgi:hypothetical protein
MGNLVTLRKNGLKMYGMFEKTMHGHEKIQFIVVEHEEEEFYAIVSSQVRMKSTYYFLLS